MQHNSLFSVLFLLLTSAAACHARELFQVPTQPAQIPAMDVPVTENGPAATTAAADATVPPASPAATYSTFAEALKAANSTTNDLSTLLKAIKVAGVAAALNATTASTILAPTDRAFRDRLAQDLNMTAQEFLSNKTLVLQVLSYHTIPSAALLSSQLTEGEQLQTALEGAEPLVVKFDRTKKDGSPRATPQIEFEGETNSAEVEVPDILVGASVIHIVNDVLLPRSVCPAC